MKKKLDEVGRIRREMDLCRQDPMRFVKNWLGIETFWEKQVEIIEAIRDHRKVAVASCHESGKTFCAARPRSGSSSPTGRPSS